MLIAVGMLGACGSSTSSFCRAWERPDRRLDGVEGPGGRVAAIESVIARLAPADRPPVRGLRDYAAVLFGASKRSTAEQQQIVTHFLSVDAPALDRRLRSECRVPLGRLAPFAGLQRSASEKSP